MFEKDYGSECHMCGKPMSYRHCGMCVECEMIDDYVPGDPQLEPCEICKDLTRNRSPYAESGVMCNDCEDDYLQMMADDHSQED